MPAPGFYRALYELANPETGVSTFVSADFHNKAIKIERAS
jgi:hypothetical protein